MNFYKNCKRIEEATKHGFNPFISDKDFADISNTYFLKGYAAAGFVYFLLWVL